MGSKPAIIANVATGNKCIDGLWYDNRWDASLLPNGELTFSFPTSPAFYVYGHLDGFTFTGGSGYTPNTYSGFSVRIVASSGIGTTFLADTIVVDAGGHVTSVTMPSIFVFGDGLSHNNGGDEWKAGDTATSPDIGPGSGFVITVTSAFYGVGECVTGFSTLASAAQDRIRESMANFTLMTGIPTREITESAILHATCRHAGSTLGVGANSAVTTPPGGQGGTNISHKYGDSWYVAANIGATTIGQFGATVLTHEDGHGIGLKHPFDSSGFGLMCGANDGTGNASDFDAMQWTLQTYRQIPGGSATTFNYGPNYWGAYDRQAIQGLYGKNNTSSAVVLKFIKATGVMQRNGVSGQDPGDTTILVCVPDTGSNISYDFTDYTAGFAIDLTPGAWITPLSSQRRLMQAAGSIYPPGCIQNPLDTTVSKQIKGALWGSGTGYVVTGNGADNVFTPGSGTASVDGTVAGTNTLSLSGLRREYGFAGAVCTDMRGGAPNGVTTMANIQTIAMADQTRPLATIDKFRMRWAA